ncbi:tRNA (adenosine(37)-N6)-threonylcarbamoyltransferase complex ATPase subunit type 1 TsaE [Patescibacteria group bacterium]|nr:tRNA (adenosine(37)-N6)-threonylcarbamoyltransferase complex ATPase subunit type 1 TsaE [Patescibacteria group bacterium]
MEILTKSAEETKEFGKKIATDLIRNQAAGIRNNGLTLALTGELGSGKTTFVQGFAYGLGIKQRIISPTFILVRRYDIKLSTLNSQLSTFYHVDLYRLEEKVEVEVRNLGIDEFWKNPENIIAIEWAEKIRSVVPKNATWIEFENMGKDKRKITVI